MKNEPLGKKERSEKRREEKGENQKCKRRRENEIYGEEVRKYEDGLQRGLKSRTI